MHPVIVFTLLRFQWFDTWNVSSTRFVSFQRESLIGSLRISLRSTVVFCDAPIHSVPMSGVLIKRTHVRRLAAIMTASALCAFGATSLAPTAFANTTATAGGLSKVVMPTPAGLISDRTSLSGGPTGRIGFSEATSSDCNVSNSLHQDWIASQLKYFVSSIQSPQKYLLVCVTLMKTSAAAKASVQKVADNPYLPAKMPAFASIPGAHAQETGPATQIVFSIGQYFIFVAGLDLTASGATSVHLVKSFAIAQYHRAAK